MPHDQQHPVELGPPVFPNNPGSTTPDRRSQSRLCAPQKGQGGAGGAGQANLGWGAGGEPGGKSRQTIESGGNQVSITEKLHGQAHHS